MNSQNHDGQHRLHHKMSEAIPGVLSAEAHETAQKMLPEHCASSLNESRTTVTDTPHHVEGHSQYHHTTPHKQKKEKHFKGYTLDEISYRKLVNGLKIEVAQERVMLLLSPKAKEEAKNINGAVSSFHNFMRALDIAIVAYNVTRRISRIFRKFSRRK